MLSHLRPAKEFVVSELGWMSAPCSWTAWWSDNQRTQTILSDLKTYNEYENACTQHNCSMTVQSKTICFNAVSIMTRVWLNAPYLLSMSMLKSCRKRLSARFACFDTWLWMTSLRNLSCHERVAMPCMTAGNMNLKDWVVHDTSSPTIRTVKFLPNIDDIFSMTCCSSSWFYCWCLVRFYCSLIIKSCIMNSVFGRVASVLLILSSSVFSTLYNPLLFRSTPAVRFSWLEKLNDIPVLSILQQHRAVAHDHFCTFVDKSHQNIKTQKSMFGQTTIKFEWKGHSWCSIVCLNPRRIRIVSAWHQRWKWWW